MMPMTVRIQTLLVGKCLSKAQELHQIKMITKAYETIKESFTSFRERVVAEVGEG